MSSFGIFVLTASLLPISLSAATLTVVNTNDNGAGSLRQMIADAAAGDTVDFAQGVTGTIVLEAELFIGKYLTITGPGAANLTISGNSASRVFNVHVTQGIVSISGLTIANGVSTHGGGIRNEGHLTVANIVFSGNSASNGGGIADVGYVTGRTLSVTNCNFIGNSAGSFGGGIYSFHFQNPGLSSTEISSSSFTSNSANGVAGGAIWNEFETTSISGCTFTGNTAPGGASIANKGGTVFLQSSSLTNNVASFSGGGGIATGAVYNQPGVLNIDSATQSTDDLTASAGTTIVNGTLGNAAVIAGAGASLKFGSVSQRLASLSIGSGATVTFTSGPAAFIDSRDGKSATLGGGLSGGATVPEPGTLGLLLLGAVGVLNRCRR